MRSTLQQNFFLSQKLLFKIDSRINSHKPVTPRKHSDLLSHNSLQLTMTKPAVSIMFYIWENNFHSTKQKRCENLFIQNTRVGHLALIVNIFPIVKNPIQEILNQLNNFFYNKYLIFAYQYKMMAIKAFFYVAKINKTLIYASADYTMSRS